MSEATSAPRLEPRATELTDEAAEQNPSEFARLWRGFMTARVTLGAVLLAFQTTLYGLGQSAEPVLIAVCAVYLAATLATRLAGRPRRLGPTLGARWMSTIGVDVLAFALLEYLHGQAGINYAPLLALPVLLAAVLGSLPLAMGTAAGATLLLLAQAGLSVLNEPAVSTPMVAQSALTGAGYFVIAFLASELAARLASEEQRSRRSQLVARVQREVNALVIASLNDGILVVDALGMVWAANPAACRLLGHERIATQTPFSLTAEAGWRELLRLNMLSFSSDTAQSANIVFNLAGSGPQYAHVRTRMTAGDGEGDGTERLCVMFVQDQRELEARMRTEKLVSMGRMSAAVAHEIRNPLSAIVQANALLDEEVEDPKLKRLIQMVEQNAGRLERIVDEVLNISRLHRASDGQGTSKVRLNSMVQQICQDWSQQGGRGELPAIGLCDGDPEVVFESDHLRRVLVNLLDNAQRYAGPSRESIQVETRAAPGGGLVLAVWSDGKPMDASVERHLFEPFFSSESRSTGLGLYICRELCEGHGAAIGFTRTTRRCADRDVDGNQFHLTFARPQTAARQSGHLTKYR